MQYTPWGSTMWTDSKYPNALARPLPRLYVPPLAPKANEVASILANFELRTDVKTRVSSPFSLVGGMLQVRNNMIGSW